ncbi:MAG: HAD-IA family hydrolase [Actinomycetota bacterium]|nr:HAD-IA family hydrolase [Actinomycetota bacterium]
MAIRTVLWDADGVLQQGVPSWPGVFAELVDNVDAFGSAVWADLPAALAGRLDMAAHVETVIEEQGLSDRRDAIVDVWGMIEPLPETWALVTAVRSGGTPCYLATNQDNLRTSYMRRLLAYDELLDGAYYSCEVGAAKPGAQYFLHIADDLGLAPRELLFVDDQAENVAAAREIGLHAELWHHEQGVDALRARFAALGVAL